MRRSDLQARSARAVEDLRARLEVAEETLRGIRAGEVDAVVMETAQGEQIFALKRAERSYRVLVENMTEGAGTFSVEGTVLYANACLARIVGQPLHKLIGSNLSEVVAADHAETLRALLHQAETHDVRAELYLRRSDGTRVPTFVSMSSMEEDGQRVLCGVITDLTQQKKGEELLFSEQFANVVLSQAAEAILVCNERGEIIRASGVASRLAAGSPLFHAFDEAIPLKLAEANEQPGSALLSAALKGEVVTGALARLDRPGPVHELLVSVAPLWGRQEKVIGCVVTLTDVTRLRSVEAELKTAIQARDEFISIASHELRNPLAALQLHVEALQRMVGGEQAHLSTRAETIRRQVDRLARLISSVLEVSRINSGQLSLESEPVDLAEIAKDLVERFRAEARVAGCELNLQALPTSGSWDPVRVEQVVANLLSNAVKYAPGAPIDVRVAPEGERAVLTVRDHGPGIPDVERERVFGRFERIVTSRTVQGLGLGLYITRQIVEAMGGRIDVRNSNPGALFTVELPMWPDRAPRH